MPISVLGCPGGSNNCACRYCVCFSTRGFCHPQCTCDDCKNSRENKPQRLEAIQSYLSNDPRAFSLSSLQLKARTTGFLQLLPQVIPCPSTKRLWKPLSLTRSLCWPYRNPARRCRVAAGARSPSASRSTASASRTAWRAPRTAGARTAPTTRTRSTTSARSRSSRASKRRSTRSRSRSRRSPSATTWRRPSAYVCDESVRQY